MADTTTAQALEIARMEEDLSIARRQFSDLLCEHTVATNRITELEAQVAQYKQDAERYRWLREKSAYVAVNPHHRTCLWVLRNVFEIPNKDFNAAVDAAREAPPCQTNTKN